MNTIAGTSKQIFVESRVEAAGSTWKTLYKVGSSAALIIGVFLVIWYFLIA